ncbi:MAG: alpha-L-fucosidase [Candidatus Latescibacteria bacterium]|nr:alpha-L-fucosidase [Candidatus Latescibacterota bacterium]
MSPERDLVSPYVEACRNAGLKVGFYYSLLDWRWKAYFEGPKAGLEPWRVYRSCSRTGAGIGDELREDRHPLTDRGQNGSRMGDSL